jgi:hypothetical protein
MAVSSPTVTTPVVGGAGVTTPSEVVSSAGVEPVSGAATGWGTASAGTSGCAGSSALVSPATSFNRGEQRTSSTRPESPPISSLRALLWQEGSRAGVTIPPEATVGGGWATESTERGDL